MNAATSHESSALKLPGLFAGMLRCTNAADRTANTATAHRSNERQHRIRANSFQAETGELFLAMAAHCMPASITHLVSAEVVERPVSTFRMRTSVAMMWIEAVIHMAIKVLGAAEPRAGSDENAATEPLRPVVPVWATVIRREIVVTVGANRFRSDIDGDLR